VSKSLSLPSKSRSLSIDVVCCKSLVSILDFHASSIPTRSIRACEDVEIHASNSQRVVYGDQRVDFGFYSFLITI
jgi:hypothetical protein